MTYSEGAIRLAQPDLANLPRIEDRVSFLFLDRCRIEQGRTGLEAWSQNEGELTRTAVPAASLAVLALGPGTSVTGPAMATLHRCGTAVVFTDGAGVVGYATTRPLTSSGKWAAAQARLWADSSSRLRIARTLYQRRFPGEPIPDNVPLSTLRGLEGHRIRALYKQLSARHHIRQFHRVTTDASDPVNVCLNRANALLYGVALAVVSAFGLNPALGFIHEGASGALLYDLADLHKAEVSIPAAFIAAEQAEPLTRIGTLVRDRIHRQRVLHAMVQTVQELLTPGLDPTRGDEDLLIDDTGFVPGLVNWATR